MFLENKNLLAYWIAFLMIICKDVAGDKETKLHRSHPATTITVELGTFPQSRTLPCDVEMSSAKPHIVEWTKKNDDNWSLLPPYSLDQNRSLVLANLKPSDSGKYVCKVCIEEDCAKSVITLEVTLKMQETSMLNETVLINSTVRFECSLQFQSFLGYKVEFYKYHIVKQKHLRHLMNFTVLNHRNESFLELKNVSSKDEGWYTCAVVLGESYQFIEKKKFERNFVSYKSAYLKVLEEWPDGNYFEESSTSVNVVLISITTVFILVLCTILGITYYKIKKKRFKIPNVETRKHPSVMVLNNLYRPCQDCSEYEHLTYSKREFPRSKLILGTALGEGAFGKVVMAEALDLLAEGESVQVAVKMLRENHSDDDIKDFVSEMELLKKIDKHPNVIRFLGCCSKNGPLYVIVEYAAYGNLKNFLRDRHTSLTTSKLISFAMQISEGMEFLASLKIIHRDLAARNILVGEDFIMKIADFGLARDVYDHDYYRKMTSGKLPIYWMTPESLEERIFDSRSDVWSFGVLLWEIMTLGRSPYSVTPGWESLLQYLKQGNRLERSESCPGGVYQIMRDCWRLEAGLRPTFGEIAAALDNLET